MAEYLPTRSILYYPTINIPTGSWLRQAILYWDEVGSIIPEEFEAKGKLSPDLQFLANEGFFRAHRPYEAFEYDENKISFREDLKEIISSEEFLKTLPPKSERRLSFAVYKEKTRSSIYQLLRSRGLARSMEGEPYYFFEEKTFYIYMALLARYICWGRSVMGIHIPGTNLEVYEKLVFKTNSSQNGTPSFETQFANLLPIPGPNTPLDDILSFRYRRQDELLKFRLITNRLQSQLKSCQSREEARGIVADFQEEIAVGLTDLRRSMESDNIKLAFGTLGSIVTSNLGDLLVGTFDPITSAIPTLLGSVVISYCLAKKFQEKDIQAKSPVSYLFHIQNEFGVA